VFTVDLPISTPGLGAAEYAQTIVDALEGSHEPILVGHSMAGLVIPLVAERRAVRRLVFLAGFLPKPGMSVNEQRATEPIDGHIAPTTSEWTDLGDDVWMVGPATATELFYHDVPRDIARWATDRLRPQCYAVMNEVTPLETWPDVESRTMVCADDRALDPDWLRAAARDRLGVEAIEIAGGHSPFLSRPAQLARLIDSLATGPVS
jgi:pimeloyl-ACP methyl ester carboxylesterase